ncbi:MAG: DUF2442 domain-containing protein [Pirellulales bacterium]
MKMKSAGHGMPISAVEVTNISEHGFWLLLRDHEYFLPFEQFPWFRNASVGQICKVELPSSHHLYWPLLDIDLALESIEHPERFPLVSKVQPIAPARPI